MAIVLILAALFFVCNGDDEEIGMRVPEIVGHWGYPVETIKVTTADGYILSIHRIPYGKNGVIPTKPRPVVFLQHGLETSSSNFVTNLPEKSLGFMLADSGFDVWMGNVRGNLYSIGHTSLDTKKHDYWKFSWEQMMKYDLTAMIDKALAVTNQSQLYYVGHSQGTLIMFSKLATEPEFGAKIKKFFALAPVGTVANIKGLVSVIAKDFYLGFEFLEKVIGENQFLPDNKFTQIIEDLLCTNPITDGICDNVLFLISGPESGQFNTSRVPVYITDLPSGTSTMNILHWAQMVRSKNVQAFDWENEKENLAHHGTETPPVYDFSKVNVDTYLYWSDADWLADKEDIEGYLLKKLNPEIIKLNNHLENFNHLDFIWGERAAKEIYRPIIDIISADTSDLP